jgi:hypothetical protein
MDFTSWDVGLRPDELALFGVRGMKWGTRRFQNMDGSLTPLGRQQYGVKGERSARGVSRDLRRLEKERAGAKARADYYENRSKRKIAKAERRAEKTGNPVKLSNKTQKFIEKSKNYSKLANKAESMSRKVIKSALNKGYSVRSRDTMRFVRKGKDKGLMLLGRKGTSVNSIKYHVRNDGLGVRRHKKSIGAINRARHKTNFL